MSEVDALFRLLNDAPVRSAEIVKRVALAGMDFPQLAALFGVDVPRAQVLAFRAFLDVLSGGRARVPDEREPVEVEQMVRPLTPARSPLSQGEGVRVRQLWDQLSEHRIELELMLERSATAFAASPDRKRDEWLRLAAIALVLALTAFFYYREQNKPRPPPQRRPTTAPATPP